MRKKPFILLLFILYLTILSGCWDMREINEIGLVTAVGIDKGTAPNSFKITVQIANPTASGSGESSSGGGSSPTSEEWVGTGEGSSIFDAVRKLSAVSSRRIMWAHNNVVIIGESLAREGILPVVDFFTHDPELRMKSMVVVAQGDAQKFISAKVGMEKPTGISYILIESYRRYLAESVRSEMLNVSASIKNSYANPLISSISMTKLPGKPSEGASGGSNAETAKLSGAAVFKRDKMMGWLSGKESRGISWILNQTQNTVVSVSDPQHEGKSVAVETLGMKAKIKSEMRGELPAVTITVSGIGNIVEEDNVTSQSMEEMKENVGELVDKTIEDEIRNSLEVVQKKYGVDVLDFAAIVHAQNRKAWKNGLKDNWQEVFPKIPVTVNVNINVSSSSLNQEPMKIY